MPRLAGAPILASAEDAARTIAAGLEPRGVNAAFEESGEVASLQVGERCREQSTVCAGVMRGSSVFMPSEPATLAPKNSSTLLATTSRSLSMQTIW